MSKSKKILITGCSGFLAAHLLDAYEHQKKNTGEKNDTILYGITEITGFDSPRLKVYHVDMTKRGDVFQVLETIEPGVIIHLAAISNVGFSWKQQKLTYEVNFIGTSNLLEAVNGIVPRCRVLLMSSAELYGGNNGNLCPETLPISISYPQNPYMLSKMAMEMVGNLYTKAFKTEIVRLRSFNFTGPGQSKQFVASEFSYQIARIEEHLQEPIIAVGNLSAARDISDVRDIARYVKTIGEHEKVDNNIYNLCSGQFFSIRDILEKLLALSSRTIKIVEDPARFRPVDIPKLWGDNTLIRDEFGLNPNYDITRTLTDLLNYWRDQVKKEKKNADPSGH